MKKILTTVILALALTGAAMGQNTVNAATSAGVNVRAHSTLGIDLNDGSAGMETKIDQVQLYFELFQGDGVSIIPDPKLRDEVQVRVGLTGSKWVLHWWNDQNQPGTTGPVANALYQSPAGLSAIDVSLVWRDFWLGIAGWSSDQEAWPLMHVDRASLRSLLDLGGAYTLAAGDSVIGLSLPILPTAVFDRNRQSLEAAAYPTTGMIKLGYDTEILDLTLKAGSRSSWDSNDAQAWAFGLDMAARPLPGWTLDLEAAGGVNYPANPWAAGLSSAWLLPLSRNMGLEPFVGADTLWPDPTANAVPDYEVGGGLRWYWQGADETLTHEYVTWNIWDGKIKTGLQASANLDQDALANAHLSLAEAATPRATIPRLGYLAVLELADLGNQGGSRGLGAFALVEYNLVDRFVPYVWGRYAQGYTGTTPNGNDPLSLSAGLRYIGTKYLVADLAYRNDSITGLNPYVDYGQLTLSFRVKNF